MKKFCIECKWYKLEMYGYLHNVHWCNHLEALDIITKEPTAAREERRGGLCGPAGNLWEKK